MYDQACVTPAEGYTIPHPTIVRLRTVAVALCVSGALVAGCAACSGGERVPAIDLLQLFPYTEAGQTTAHIDFGTPESQAFLRQGWSAPATLPGGASGAWAIRRRATVQFAIPEPHDARLVLRAGLLADGAPQNALLTLSLNGRRLGLLRVGRGLAEHSIRLPARHQRVGTNVLRISNALLSGLPRRGHRDGTRAVALDWLRLDGVNVAARPSVVSWGGTPTLVLPAPLSVDFFVRLPRDPELVAGVPPQPQGETVRLSVIQHLDGESERRLVDGTVPHGGVRVQLRGPAGAVTRVTLAASGSGSVRLAGLTILGRPVPPPEARPPDGTPPERPNVVLFLVDTLRADRLGSYGYHRPTSPHLDALAAQGIVFTNFRAQASWTLPATASIMTGLEPPTHGAVSLATPIRNDVPTLAEVLRANGYRTAGFVTNVNVRGDLGFRRGFDRYQYLPEDQTRPTVFVSAGELVQTAADWLPQAGDEPFFLYLHASDPHSPYRPSPEVAALVGVDGAGEDGGALLKHMIRSPAARTPEALARVQALYDADVRMADEGLGALLRTLRERGLDERTLVIVTADHGEEFLEHGAFQHGHTLFREQLAVPLVIRRPRGEGGGRRIATLARQIDVLPTLLQLLRIAAPAGVQGRALLGRDGGNPVEPESFAHTSLGIGEVLGVSTLSWKVVQTTGRQRQRVQVFRLDDDPDERHDLASARPSLVGYGRQALARFATNVPRPGSEQIDAFGVDDATAKRLRALGYAGD